MYFFLCHHKYLALTRGLPIFSQKTQENNNHKKQFETILIFHDRSKKSLVKLLAILQSSSRKFGRFTWCGVYCPRIWCNKKSVHAQKLTVFALCYLVVNVFWNHQKLIRTIIATSIFIFWNTNAIVFSFHVPKPIKVDVTTSLRTEWG